MWTQARFMSGHEYVKCNKGSRPLGQSQFPSLRTVHCIVRQYVFKYHPTATENLIQQNLVTSLQCPPLNELSESRDMIEELQQEVRSNRYGYPEAPYSHLETTIGFGLKVCKI